MPETMHGEPYRFEFVGGEPCLDFTNTVGGDRRTTPTEHLHGYGDLVAWARQGELLAPAQARALLLRAQREAEALPHRRVVQSGRGFSLGWDGSDDLRRMLWPVALSAAELLAGDHAAPVKLCGMWEASGCSWLFVDESRNGSRRWCSMKDCGNRAKARRHYQRVKKG